MNQIDVSPKQYFPHIYNDVPEIETLSTVEEGLFTAALEKIEILWRNGYLQSCDIDGIERYENILGIVADPTIETIEFRRSRLINRYAIMPTYTMPWLRTRLDELLGIGNWDAYVDFEKRELVVETLQSNTVWTHEVSVLVHQVKPANLVFISAPMNLSRIAVSEQVDTQKIIYKYTLGNWALGQTPFIETLSQEVAKLPEIPSIQDKLLSDVASFTASDIASALINNTLLIPREQFIEATSNANLVKIAYEVFASHGLGTITNIKLRNGAGDVLAEINVAIDNTFNVRMSHKIKFEEAVNETTT